jgi:DNA-binding transcriptional regulator of glucitol operon
VKKFYAIVINSLSPGFAVIEEIPAKTRSEAHDDFEGSMHNNDHYVILDEEQFSNLQLAMKKYEKK